MFKVYDNSDNLLATTDDYCVAGLVVSTFGDEFGYVSLGSKSRKVWIEGYSGEALASYDEFYDHVMRVEKNARGLEASESYPTKHAYRVARELEILRDKVSRGELPTP